MMADMPDDPKETPEDPAGQSSPSPGAGARSPYTSDRVLGIVCLVFGLWYVWQTRAFVITQFGSGPVGPKTLPTIVGLLFAAIALVLIVKPDESPKWASFGVWWRLAAVVATSFIFGQLIDRLGFIIASTILAVVIGRLFKGPLAKLVPLSAVFSIVVAFVFNNWLELRLPAGWWGGF